MSLLHRRESHVITRICQGSFVHSTHLVDIIFFWILSEGERLIRNGTVPKRARAIASMSGSKKIRRLQKVLHKSQGNLVCRDRR